MELPGGRQFIPAMLIATAVGIEFGLTSEQIEHGLKNIGPIGGRFTIHNLGKLTLIDDAYNASPDSMKVAIDGLADFKGRRVVVLGEMKELGSYDVTGHKEVGKYIFNKVDLLYCVGRGGKLIGESAISSGLEVKKVKFFDEIEPNKIGDVILDELRDNDVILIKASRSIGLDRLVKYLLTKI